MRRFNVLVALTVFTAFAIGASSSHGWGKTGHPLINKGSVDSLPEGELKTFLKKHQDWLGSHAMDADRAKKKNRAQEGPQHYINGCEGGAKLAEYPRTWKAAVEKFGLYAATKNGRLPWAIEETFDKLVEAFKDRDGPAILRHAAWLGHYAGDAHVPLHACANHDGQLTGQKGIHLIWEQHMIEHNLEDVQKEVKRIAAMLKPYEIQGDVSAWAFDRLIQGDKLAHDLLEKDKGFRASGREKALYKATAEVAHRRLAEATEGVASLWLTAWVRAGKPPLPADKFKEPEGEPAPAAGKPEPDDHDPVEPPKDANQTEKGTEPTEPAKPAEPAPADAPPRKNDETPKEAPTKPSAKAVKCAVPGLWVREDDVQPGAIVDFLDAGSAAANAGALVGDVIISVDGAPVNSVATLKKRLEDYKSGDVVPLTVLRAGAESFVKVRLP